MKKRITKFTAVLSLALVLTAMLFVSSCGEEKKLKEKARNYLTELQGKLTEKDTLTLTGKSGYSSKSDPVVFPASSSLYGKSFTVFVNRDGSAVTDNYYTLFLQDDAQDMVADLIADTLPGRSLGLDVSLQSYSSPALSYGKVKTLQELYQAMDGAMCLNVTVPQVEGASLQEEEVDLLIRAFLDKEWYCTFSPYGEGIIWFDITKNGVWKTTRTGADNGAFLERDEYPMD